MQTDFGKQPGAGGESSLGGFYENLKKAVELPKIEEFASAVTRLTQSAVEINKVFLQGRQRIVELQQSVADAVPNVLRLGGEINDVTRIMGEVAKASRRNVAATTEEVEKLFAAQQLLGEGAEELSNSFLDVGMSVRDVGKSLEESIQYVQSIGGNASQVVKTMRVNMEQLNRYQFEGGVQGLTKMAAQASMLRFDMSQTFALAEKVLSPENAIETAAAFQRLGVTAGNLVDPFQLMNQSINDPSGLQTSLSQVAKQFTYFDEKTKSFKISPQGVLTLKEMETQTGVSAREMSKMGLAAAELDKRLSAVNRAGLKVGSEEDKQFLANIARMGEGGEYEVQIKDSRGDLQTKKLSEITQTEFDKLIKEQKDGPKTLEEMTRSQMGIQQSIEADVSAIRNKIVGGVATATPVLKGFEGARNVMDIFGGELSKIGKTKDVREKIESAMQGIEGLMKDLSDPKKNKMEVLQKYADNMSVELKKIGGGLDEKFKEALKNTESKLSTSNWMEKSTKSLIGEIVPSAKSTGQVAESTIDKGKREKIDYAVKSVAESYGTSASSKVEMAGGFKLDVNFNGTEKLSTTQLQQIDKILHDWVRSIGIQDLMIKVTQKQDVTKQPQT